MANDYIVNINKSNQSTEKQQCPKESNVKSGKRQKKSLVKNCFLGHELDVTTKRKTSSMEQQKISNAPKTTRVKSASWKRSEKSTTPFNNLTNKSHKKSSNWLKFSNSKLKKSETEQPYNGSESLSACRPGTTYSDVLFGAGCSNLVKMKNCITPRFHSNQSANAAQKKLSQRLFKFKGNPNNKVLAENETEEKKNLFPALQTIKKKFFPASLKIGNNNHNIEVVQESLSTPSSPSPTNAPDEAEAIVALEMENLTLNENKIPFDDCLVQHLQHVDDSETTDVFADGKKYLYNAVTKIPKWNFTCIETGTSSDFPKFLYQFEDENYLKAEKIALLGLKLALGNSVPNCKLDVNA